jgi:hypothetical protein
VASAVIGQFVEWQLNRLFNRGSGRLSNSRSQSKLKHRHMEIAIEQAHPRSPCASGHRSRVWALPRKPKNPQTQWDLLAPATFLQGN